MLETVLCAFQCAPAIKIIRVPTKTERYGVTTYIAPVTTSYAYVSRGIPVSTAKQVSNYITYILVPDLYAMHCLKKVPTFQLSVTSSSLNRFSKFL